MQAEVDAGIQGRRREPFDFVDLRVLPAHHAPPALGGKFAVLLRLELRVVKVFWEHREFVAVGLPPVNVAQVQDVVGVVLGKLSTLLQAQDAYRIVSQKRGHFLFPGLPKDSLVLLVQL